MMRRTGFVAIVVIGVAALVIAERRQAEAPVRPAAFLYLVADTEHEMMRLPVAFTRLTDDEEIKIGDRLYGLYDRRRGPTGGQDQLIEAYIARVGTKVSANAHRKLPYRFHYIPDSDFVNAFALPGGHVYIGAGLVGLMETEDELAAILGHEIEHIDHYHCAERVQLESALRKIPLAEVALLPVILFQAGYSKTQEREADREGTILAVSASYSPAGALQMFESFERSESELVANRNPQRRPATPQQEVSEIARKTLEDYFRTHPPTNERAAQIRNLIASGSITNSAST